MIPILSAADKSVSDSSWQMLPPLPDAVGFAGMFAGTADGKLFAGGGSQFPETPIWNGGKKTYGDRVFVLDSGGDAWRELPARLPSTIAHAASAPWGDAVIAAGGMNDSGALRGVYSISLRGSELSVQQLPDLPHPLVYAVGAVVKDVFYVAGGVSDPASTEPLREAWALPLSGPENERKWQRLPDFPGLPGIVPAAASDGKYFYLFGGMGFVPGDEGKAVATPLAGAFRYDPSSNSWTKLADLPDPRVGASTPAPMLPDGRLLLAGGYGAVFPGPQKEHPGFDAETFLYNPSSDTWTPGPALPCERQIDPDSPTSPGPEPMVAAPAVLWNGAVVIVSGEVRPATRSPAVLAIPCDSLP